MGLIAKQIQEQRRRQKALQAEMQRLQTKLRAEHSGDWETRYVDAGVVALEGHPNRKS